MIDRRTLLHSALATVAGALMSQCVGAKPPSRRLEALLDKWEQLPSYWQWVDQRGYGAHDAYDRIIQGAYEECREAVGADPQNARLHYVLARLIDLGGGTEDQLCSREILDRCATAIRMRPGYHEAHALSASSASFLSMVASDSKVEIAEYSRLAVRHARRACALRPGNDEYTRLLRHVRETARHELGRS